MSPKILIIFEYQILFEILDEIHKSINFKNFEEKNFSGTFLTEVGLLITFFGFK